MIAVSSMGIDFIASWESYREQAYRDMAGVWTIGYGITRWNGRKISPDDRMDLITARYLLTRECEGIARRLEVMIHRELKQHESDSLISLSYNIGVQAFKTSTLLRELNENEAIFPDYFTRWSKAHVDGRLKLIPGLLRRRKSEWRLFNLGDYSGNKFRNGQEGERRA